MTFVLTYYEITNTHFYLTLFLKTTCPCSQNLTLYHKDIYLQDDVVEADEVLWTGPSLVLVGFRFLQFSLQSMGHALIPLHQRTQLDVGQVTARRPTAHLLFTYQGHKSKREKEQSGKDICLGVDIYKE